MSNEKKPKLTETKVYQTNPFMEKITDELTTRRKRTMLPTTGITIVEETGEFISTNYIAKFEEVDDSKFIKVFIDNLAGFMNLSKNAIQILHYLWNTLEHNKDFVLFDIDDCKKYTKYASDTTIYKSLSELINKEFIARSNHHYKYFINPTIFFNGNRVNFVRGFIKKSAKIKQQEKQQENLFENYILENEKEKHIELPPSE